MATAASRVLLPPPSPWTIYKPHKAFPASQRLAVSPRRALHHSTPLAINTRADPFRKGLISLHWSQSRSYKEGTRPWIRDDADDAVHGWVAGDFRDSITLMSKSYRDMRDLTMEAVDASNVHKDIVTAMAHTIRSSTIKLINLRRNHNPGAASPPASPSVAVRVDLLKTLEDARVESAHVNAEISDLGHDAGRLVKHLIDDKSQLDSPAYSARTMYLAFEIQCGRILRLARQLRAAVEVLERGPSAHALSGQLRESLSDHVLFAQTAHTQIRRSARVLEFFMQLDNTTYGLCLYSHYRFFRPFLVILNRMRSRQSWVREKLNQDSAIARNAESLCGPKITFIRRLVADFSKDVLKNAIAAGEAGALAPFATVIRQQFVDDVKERYRAECKRYQYRQLLLWGYNPSSWRRRYCNPLGRPIRQVLYVRYVQRGRKSYVGKMRRTYQHLQSRSQQSLGKFRLKIRKHAARDALTNGPRRYRSELRARRKTALGKLRKLLTSTLLSFEERTVLSLFNPSTMTIPLEGMPIPSKSTLLGKTCEILGFGGSQSAHKKHKWNKFDKITNKVKPGQPTGRPKRIDIETGARTTKSANHSTGIPYLRSGQTAQPFRPSPHSNELKPGQSTGHPKRNNIKSGARTTKSANDLTGMPYFMSGQTAQPFRPSPHLRASHSTMFFTDADQWKEMDAGLANLDTDGGETVAGDDCVYSPSNRDSGSAQGADLPENTTPHDQNFQPSTNMMYEPSKEDRSDLPNNTTPHERNFQPSTNMMHEPSEEDQPSESEHGGESERELDEDAEMEEPEEQHTPLTYQIPPGVLIDALQAPPQTRASYWSQKLYRGPENEELLVYYCSNMDMAERVAKHFIDEKVLGFDIEWKPFGATDSIKENVSLIQIANENRIALFHIARFSGKTPEQLLPPTLKTILESPETLKVGVAVKGDVTRVRKYLNVEVRGVFELSRLHNLVEYYATDPSKVSNKLVKLSTQVQQHLLLPLYKGEPLADEPRRLGSVRESDWSRRLGYEQIQYAAADAYAGFRLFDALELKRKKLKPTPPIPRVCDYDNKTVTCTPAMQKAKNTKNAKTQTEKVLAEAISGLEVDDPEDEIYETAAEELAEEDEEEDSDSEFASGHSGVAEDDSDADYVPKHRSRVDLVQHSDGSSASSELQGHRIGRVDFSRLTIGDTGYSSLPRSSSRGESSSDESEAFDVPPKAPPRRRSLRKPMQETESLKVEMEHTDDEFADPELEAALDKLDFNTEPLQTRDASGAEEQPDGNMLDQDTMIKTSDIGSNALDHVDSSQATEPPRPLFKPLVLADSTFPTPQYDLATTWAQTYLESTIPSPTSTLPSRIRCTIPPLRAYHLWYHQRVPLEAIGTYLRNPPLAQNTVSNYIIQAISVEKLQYRDDELITLIQALPANLRLGRYGWLSKKLGVIR